MYILPNPHSKGRIRNGRQSQKMQHPGVTEADSDSESFMSTGCGPVGDLDDGCPVWGRTLSDSEDLVRRCWFVAL